MDTKNKKSAWAALATIGLTAVAAGAAAFIKVKKEKRKKAEAAQSAVRELTAEQQMVYNEAVSSFLSLNERIYELRRHRRLLQPLVVQLATAAASAEDFDDGGNADIRQLAADISRFVSTQVPFINASLAIAEGDANGFVDFVRAPVGDTFDPTLDEEPTGADIADGTPVSMVLKLGYYFPASSIAPHPVKSVVLA